ncbi:MAG: phosphate signaling complex protein PhoU [Magnetococcales bacterium]|nr:phosphate signaling complex protein PhoU [Magnetococcales bacterium]
MKQPHTVHTFDQDLEKLDTNILRGFELVERLVRDAVTAITRFDLQLADQVVRRDGEIDKLDMEIEMDVVRILALRAPMAEDLRRVLGALKVSVELERIGDLGKNLAKRVPVLAQHPLPEAIGGLLAMARLVQDQLDRMNSAWADKDPRLAMQVWFGDEAVDALYDSFFRDLLTHMMESPRNISSCTHLLFIAKNLERIGDHITNIAENLYFIDSGCQLEDCRPKGDETFRASVTPASAFTPRSMETGPTDPEVPD